MYVRASSGLPLNDMDDTVGHQDIGHNDLDAVGENVSILDGDIDHSTGQGLEGVTILQRRAVTNRSRHHCAQLVGDHDVQ